MQPDPTTTTEWGCMEIAPKKPHGRTFPKNQIKRGHVHPRASREEAEQLAAWRDEIDPHHPLAVVSRTVTVTMTAWETE